MVSAAVFTCVKSSVNWDNFVGLLPISSQSTEIVVAAVYSLNLPVKVVASSFTQKYILLLLLVTCTVSPSEISVLLSASASVVTIYNLSSAALGILAISIVPLVIADASQVAGDEIVTVFPLAVTVVPPDPVKFDASNLLAISDAVTNFERSTSTLLLSIFVIFNILFS